MKESLFGGIQLLLHMIKVRDRNTMIVCGVCLIIPVLIYITKAKGNREHYFPFLSWKQSAGKWVLYVFNMIMYVLFILNLLSAYYRNIKRTVPFDRLFGVLHEAAGICALYMFYLFVINYKERKKKKFLFSTKQKLKNGMGYIVYALLFFGVWFLVSCMIEVGCSNHYRKQLKHQNALISEYLPAKAKQQEEKYRKVFQGMIGKIGVISKNEDKKKQTKRPKTNQENVKAISYQKIKEKKKFSIALSEIDKEKKKIYYAKNIEEVKTAMYMGFYHRQKHFTISYSGGEAMRLPSKVKDMVLDVKENYDNKNTANDSDYLNNEMVKYQCQSIYRINQCNLKFMVDYYDSAKQQKYVDRRVKDALKELEVDCATDYQKVKRIHDWIVRNVDYDKTYSNHGCYSALKYGETVCNGYALLTYKMLQEAGIDNRIIIGTADNGKSIENHAWNLVEIGKKWYGLDVTWDDCLSNLQYFLVGESELGKNHFPSERYSTPAFKKGHIMSQENYLS